MDSKVSQLSSADLKSLITCYAVAARVEEQEGCFGQAELFLKQALELSSRSAPNDHQTAQIALQLGRFLSRFLSKSELPIRYFVSAFSIESTIDPSSRDAAECRLQLAQSLINADYCEEAESMLEKCIAESEKGEEIRLRVTSYLGRIRYTRQDLLRSEELLKECVAQARESFPQSEWAAEALGFLRDTLHAMGKPQEMRLFEPVLPDCQQLSPYEVAKQCTLRAKYDKENELLLLLRALRLFRSVRTSSWYVAAVLWWLHNYFFRSDGNLWELGNEANAQLSAVMPELPCTSTLLSLNFESAYSLMMNQDLLQKLLSLAADTDEVLAGEALLSLLRSSAVFNDNESSRRLEEYLLQHPSSMQSARLYFSDPIGRYCSKYVSLSEELRTPPLATAEAISRLAQRYMRRPELESQGFGLRPAVWYNDAQSLETALSYQLDAVQRCESTVAISFPTADNLILLAKIYQDTGKLLEAEAMYREAVEIVRIISPESENMAECWHEMGLFYARVDRDADTEVCLKRAFDILQTLNSESDFAGEFLSDYLSFYVYTSRLPEASSLLSTYLDVFRGSPTFRLLSSLDLASWTCVPHIDSFLKSFITAKPPTYSPDFLQELGVFWNHRMTQSISVETVLSTRDDVGAGKHLETLAAYYKGKQRFGEAEIALVARHKTISRWNACFQLEAVFRGISQVYGEMRYI